ncbi:MAG: alpha/beta hydrolase family protein [Acutalibacteraceae bacterium]
MKGNTMIKKTAKAVGVTFGVIILLLIILLLSIFGFERHNFSNINGVEKREFSCMREDLEIRGTVFLPAGTDDDSFPIAVVCHEFMANRLFSFPYAYTLAQNGYAAFCFDFNGGGFFSQSEGKSVEMSVLTEKEDLKAVLDFAKKQDYTKKGDILLMGCSQGGLVCALTAAEMQDEISGLILQYPALSIPDDARKGSMIKAEFDPDNIPDRLNCGPMKLGKQYVTDVIDMNVYQSISGYMGKVLLIHGDADTLVDISYSKEAYRVYQENGADAGFKLIPGAGHIFIKPSHIKLSQKYISEFLSEKVNY